MKTNIHTTRKLEKLIKKLISTNQIEESGVLGKWNATVFYVDRKKCWLITNGQTQYNVVLPDIKASDLDQIQEIFTNALCAQLNHDGIKMDCTALESMIGQLCFFPTDNDRVTTGFQNQRLYEFEWWKGDFDSLEIMPINRLTNSLNSCPILIGTNRKSSGYTNSIREMEELLKK